MGVADADHGAIIYQGAAHDVHDPSGVDRAAAVFAAARVSAPTSVDEEITDLRADAEWTVVTLDGRIIRSQANVSQITELPDGLYAAVSNSERRLVMVSNGRIAVGR